MQLSGKKIYSSQPYRHTIILRIEISRMRILDICFVSLVLLTELHHHKIPFDHLTRRSQMESIQLGGFDPLDSLALQTECSSNKTHFDHSTKPGWSPFDSI